MSRMSQPGFVNPECINPDVYVYVLVSEWDRVIHPYAITRWFLPHRLRKAITAPLQFF